MNGDKGSRNFALFVIILIIVAVVAIIIWAAANNDDISEPPANNSEEENIDLDVEGVSFFKADKSYDARLDESRFDVLVDGVI